jgi:hypothetical protein
MSDPAALAGHPAERIHALAGATSVDDSARLIRHYRYAVERMMRICGGWIALTPEISAKLLLGRHVWDSAQHADLLGKRLPELRAAAHVSEPANAAFAAFMAAVEAPEQPGETVERLVGIYRILKPHLLLSYRDHLRSMNEVYEPPTHRILDRMIDDERRHIRAGATILRHLITGPALERRARTWQERLEGLLAAASGVTGRGLPPPAPLEPAPPAPTLSDDAEQFIRLEHSTTRWSVPEALEVALGAFGDALLAGDVDRARGWLTSAPSSGPELCDVGLAPLELRSYRIVAFAGIGQKRVVKLRLEGLGGACTVVMRWTPTSEGWRAELADVVAVDPVTPH